MRTLHPALWPSTMRRAAVRVGATPAPLPKGETSGSLTLTAYAAVTAPPVPLGGVAAGASGMLSGALQVEGALSGGADAAVASALQLVESVGAKLAAGVLDDVIASVAAALPAELAGAIGDVAGAIPIIGAAVSVVTGVVGLVNAQIAADQDSAQKFEVALWRPIEGSWPGGKVVPADYFWNSHGAGDGSENDRLGYTSIGRLFDMMTFVTADDFTEAVDLLRDGYGYAHQDDVKVKARDLWAQFDDRVRADVSPGLPGTDIFNHPVAQKPYPITKAEQAYLKKLMNAIVSMSARYDTDGGLSLWPAFIDVVYSIRERDPARFTAWLDALRELDHMTGVGRNHHIHDSNFSAAYGGAWIYDPRPQHGVTMLIDDWEQTVDFANVRKLDKTLPATMAAIVQAASGKADKKKIKLTFDKTFVHGLSKPKSWTGIVLALGAAAVATVVLKLAL